MAAPRRATAARAATTLQVQLLGGLAIAGGSRPIPPDAWGSRKAQQLVKLLALAPDQRLARDQFLDPLWPDLDPEAAKRACSQALYLARKALGRPDLLALRGGTVALAPPGSYVIDVAAFEQAAATARQTRSGDDYARALALY